MVVVKDNNAQARAAIKRRMEERGLTQHATAELAGRKQAWTVQRLLAYPRDTILHLANKDPEALNGLLRGLGYHNRNTAESELGFGLPADVLPSSGKPPTKGVRIYVLGEVAAGMLPVLIHNVSEYIDVDESLLSGARSLEHLFALRVIGDSMVSESARYIVPGSVVVCEAIEQGVVRLEPQTNDIVVAWIRHPMYEGGVLKQYKNGEHGEVLRSWNPDGPIFKARDTAILLQGVLRLVMTPAHALAGV